MLATRPCDTEHSPWRFGKYYPSTGKTPTSPRMSDQYENSLPTQPDWQGQYQYLPQTAGSVFSQSSEQNHGSVEVAHPHPLADGEHLRLETGTEGQATLPPNQHHSLLGAQEANHSSGILESSERKEDVRGAKTADLVLDESLPSAETSGMSAASSQLNSTSSAGQSSDNPSGRFGPEDQEMALKEEMDDGLIDDEMGEGDPEAGTQPMTTAERVAARRKMKRFRLTHQQTRFLTSEFAKQPHPDAAHRERLASEIPGLSPRQVQVWFQNRRAKIKRLNADDRDRMIKMRAVPDDFDNVQALHSPYGAVHGMGMPMAPAVDYTNPSYTNPMMRPLMVDMRRQDGGDQISPTGLAPSFASIGYNPSGPISTPGVLSPISPNPNDRYNPGSHPPTTLGGGHGSLDSVMQAHRHGMRPLQSFHPREPMVRPRSDSLQSPLRSSMSWKADSMDYYMYQGVNTNSNVADRSPLVFPPSQMGQTTSSGIGGLDRGPYSNSNTQSPTGMNYQAFQHTQNRSRLRAASASLPLSLEQYRATSSGMQSPTQTSNYRATGPSSPYGASSAYTTNYPPAPLTAPLETSQPRSSNTLANVREYPESQISLPAVSTTEFPQTLQTGLNNQETRTEVRDMFHSGSVDYSHSQERHDSYGDDLGGTGSFKRERSYTLPGMPPAPMSDPRPPPHSNTT